MRFLLSLVLVVPAVAWSSNVTSIYSLLGDNCIVLESSIFEDTPEIDYYTGICRGVGSYDLKISGSDLRYSPKLLFRGKTIELALIHPFHDMGAEIVEWRVNSSDLKAPYALIYRMNISFESEDGPKSAKPLFVVRLDGAQSCVTAIVDMQEDQNTKARILADQRDLPCLNSHPYVELLDRN